MNKLDWDSKFWGIEIFSIEDKDDLEKCNLIIDKKGELFLSQALVSENNISRINSLENKGFRFVESKITLKNENIIKKNVNAYQFKEIEKKDLDLYRDAFFDLYGKVSRFQMFHRKKVNDFYYTWIVKSIDGEMADKCIGYYIDDQLAGFVAYSNHKSCLSIRLLGVFPCFQRRGISQKLLDFVGNVALNNGISELVVSTQGKNYSAINTYIKNGFMFERIEHWYYFTNYSSDIEFY